MHRKEISNLYDPEAFREAGMKLIDVLANYLREGQNIRRKVTTYVHPEKEYQFWKNYELGSDESFYMDLLDRTIHLHHPGYLGHQVAVPLPELALAGLVSDLLNNGMGIYEMGQAPTAMEKIVTDEICQHLGYMHASGGFLTSGGTLANLTALLAARSHAATHDSSKMVIMVSDQAHFCIERAALTMGIPVDNLILIPSGDDFKIKMDLLDQEFTRLTDAGFEVIAVVGCACSTSSGIYDDLEKLSNFCEQHNIWLHVDGAHGGAAIFSDKYKKLVSGIESADSVIIDAHKMMLTPALATFVLFKNAKDGYRSFSQKAEYLYDNQEDEWYQLTKRTYETTKYMMSMKIFWLLRKHGTSLINEYVTRQFELAREFGAMLEKETDFEVGHQVESNIVCFRFLKSTPRRSTCQINAEIRNKILLQGDYYIVQTQLKGLTFLRTTLMNPLTESKHLRQLIETVKSLGHTIISSP